MSVDVARKKRRKPEVFVPHVDWPEWMKPEVAAQYLSLSKDTLAKLRVKGGGPRFCRIGHSVRYKRSDLDDWFSAKWHYSTSEYLKR